MQQLFALFALGYLSGTIQLPPVHRSVVWITNLAKVLAGFLIARTILADFDFQVPLLIAFGVSLLLGDALPLERLIRGPRRPALALSTAVGVVLVPLLLGRDQSSLLVASALLVLTVLAYRSVKTIPALLAVLAATPVALFALEQRTLATRMAYILFGFFVLLEIVRVIRPTFNRILISRARWLFGPKEEHRPLGVSSSATAVALLVSVVTKPALIVSAGFGIVAVALARALEQQFPWLQKPLWSRWKDRSRALIVTLLFTHLALFPVILVISDVSPSLAGAAAVGSILAALLPLPIDPYLLSTLAAAGILLALQ